MNLSELKEAVERYRALSGLKWTTTRAELERGDDAKTIASAFLNPSAIDNASLEALGFKGGKLQCGECFLIDYPPLAEEAPFEFDTLDLRQHGASWVAVSPQPKTMGELAFLLYTLGKETK